MKKYKSEALEVIHQDAEGLYRLGIITDKEMEEYDKDCLAQEPQPSYNSNNTQQQPVSAFASPGKK